VRRVAARFLAALVLAGLALGASCGQDKGAPTTARVPASSEWGTVRIPASSAPGTARAQVKGTLGPVLVPAAPETPNVAALLAPLGDPNVAASVAPLSDPATVDQIHEYLRLSGEMDAFRARWIAALDKNRPKGAPYWPEVFWTAVKAEMQKKDLTPAYIVVLQHGVSRGLMQEVLDTYHMVGATLFVISPAGFRLRSAEAAVASETNKVWLAETLEVIQRVAAAYSPEIKAARAKYLAEHPGYVDK
jgi:hypothetical protein